MISFAKIAYRCEWELISVIILFFFQLAKNYNFSSDKELEYYYSDEDGDKVLISSDEELTQTLADNTYLVLDVKAIVRNC